MRLRTKFGGLTTLLIICAVIAFCVWSLRRSAGQNGESPAISAGDSGGKSSAPLDKSAEKVYLMLGNPSSAGADPNNYLLVNEYYALSYNRSHATSNWVAWKLTRADLSNLERHDSYRPDDRLPGGWTHITTFDYIGTGYDRGHMCSNADRGASTDSMASTFLMTNITPQTKDLNQGPWEKLESYLRTLARRRNDVYIIAGVYGTRETLKNKITVPTNDWKIAVAIPAGGDLSGVSDSTRVIAVDMPNVDGIKNNDWQKYRTTVRAIERSTGYDFLSNLPAGLQDALENKRDTINN